MNNVLSIAKDYTLRLGITPCLHGYNEMSEAITFYVHTGSNPTLKSVCMRIGESRSARADTVFRAIAYAIKTTPNISDNLYEISGIKVRKEDLRPKYVICLIAQCIERDYSE